MSTKDKYIIVDPHNMNSYYRQGYRFLAIIQEVYTNSDYNHNSKQLIGTLGNDPINISISDGSTYTKSNSYATKILMELTKQAELLYGEKSENNT